MRATTGNIIACILLVTFLAGCRKGENDPVLSLRSRKARVAGAWTASSGCGITSEANPSFTIIDQWSFSGGTRTNMRTEIGHDTTYTATNQGYKLLCTFEKDGTFAMVEETNNSSYTTYSTKGTWNFTASTGSNKEKSSIILTITMEQRPGETNYYEGADAPKEIFDIDELRNKKMVLKWKGTSSERGTVITDNGTWILEQ